jgi:hypothetical protein
MNMFKNTLIAFVSAFVLSGCVYNVTNQPVIVQQPVVRTQHCEWVSTPIHGYADLYRDSRVLIRSHQVIYSERQLRCFNF